ncbi:MAG: pyrroline-5-carboxylate reductase family protein, partial [Spirochaetota bacterium]
MRIGFIGAGNMASALARAIEHAEPSAEFIAHDVSAERLDRFAEGLRKVSVAPSNAEVAREADVTFLSVKPQVMGEVLPELAETHALIVSIAAGVRLARLAAAMPRARLVRVMPNTPGLVARMAAGYAAASGVSEEDRRLV